LYHVWIYILSDAGGGGGSLASTPRIYDIIRSDELQERAGHRI
jgi:hypothetical protein